MKTKTTKCELLKNLNSLTEDGYSQHGCRKTSFDKIPCRIEVDDVEEYARAHGYLNQEEYNKWLNNLLK